MEVSVVGTFRIQFLDLASWDPILAMAQLASRDQPPSYWEFPVEIGHGLYRLRPGLSTRQGHHDDDGTRSRNVGNHLILDLKNGWYSGEIYNSLRFLLIFYDLK